MESREEFGARREPNRSQAPLRIGAVSYLNTRPLVFGLADRLAQRWPQSQLSYDLPSRLARSLESGDLDVALIPSIEYFQHADYAIVSDACIACRGPVWSVKLYSRTPMEKIRTLGLDEGSRTSVALVRILLQQRFGLRPQLVSWPIGASFESCRADAVLVIGDRAMHAPQGEFHAVWDLGEQWLLETGLPFVFAMWVGRPGTNSRELAEVLGQARDDGMAHLPEIARREAPVAGISEGRCLSYLRDNLHFTLGPRESQGLALFHRLSVELGHAPQRALRAHLAASGAS